MSSLIRDVSEHELDALLTLNNAASRSILPMDRDQLAFFFECAAYFRVAVIDGALAGFLIALTEDANHASANFRWFKQRFERFLYIDRIVIAKSHRGAGLGRIFYADLQSFAERSEEHTSELQSLVRISYAVFCLKKQTTLQNT